MSLDIKNITKIYGVQKALDNVNFKLQKGEILGFLGPNGAGKSTMMKIICGYLPATQGDVFINGKNIQNESLECKKMIGYLPEHNPLYLDMYVKEFLHFIAGVHGVKDVKNRVEEVINLVGLQVEQNKKIASLSKGYRQRVGLAHAIIHDPELLILDEPTTGLDPNQIVEIRNLIKDLGKNKMVMLSTHIMQEVEAICDRAIIINKGQIVADKSMSDFRAMNSNEVLIVVEFEKALDLSVIKNLKGVVQAKKVVGNRFEIVSKNDIRADISKWALENQNMIVTMEKKEKSLESVFQSLTNQ
jgi:ABC-2 type transport system ATP-binding protein